MQSENSYVPFCQISQTLCCISVVILIVFRAEGTSDATKIMNHEGIFRYFLKTHPVRIDLKDKNGQTPLSWAAERGREVVVNLLLARSNVEAEFKDKNGRTPLSWAAENGHKAVVKLLVEKGALLESKDNYYVQTLLFWAVEKGHEAVVKLLVEKGAELESKTSIGRTSLSRAAKNGHEAVVKLLVEKGAELESKNNIGRTPLSWAAEKGHEAVHMTVSNHEKMEAPTELNTRTLANSLEIKTKQMKAAQYPWRHRPCMHCGGGHFDSTCMRNNIPKMQRMEQTSENFKGAGEAYYRFSKHRRCYDP